MRLTALTCACSRPEAWVLSERYMARQTLKPFQWLVLDEDDPPTVCTMGQQYVRCPQFKGKRSLLQKIEHCISKGLIKGDGLVCWENDDFYAPGWLEFCSQQLQQHALIGEGKAIYYNVRERWFYDIPNMGHASLCSTALRSSMLWVLQSQCDSANVFVDARLWQAVGPRSRAVFDPDLHPGGKRLVVGIKGMPGRVGYGGGHITRDRSAKDDLDLSKLKELIGDDAALYEKFWRKK
jgi:hypothetical protein